MKITILRRYFYETRTIGELYVDGKFFGYTLEDKVRNPFVKIYGNTAIRSGEYKCVASMSNRFKKELPEILNVRDFEGIRIHGGNTEVDSLGCILLGKSTDTTTKIWDCAERIATLTKLIKDASGCSIDIIELTFQQIDKRK